MASNLLGEVVAQLQLVVEIRPQEKRSAAGCRAGRHRWKDQPLRQAGVGAEIHAEIDSWNRRWTRRVLLLVTVHDVLRGELIHSGGVDNRRQTAGHVPHV